VSFGEQVILKDDYLSMFLKSVGGYCVHCLLNNFLVMQDLKIGEYSLGYSSGLAREYLVTWHL